MATEALNHYRIVKPLGAGGMGEVYLAEDTRLKRQVAIKILPNALATQPDRRERFEREAQAVAAINHPNIVTIHSVEQAGDTFFITMEYVDGRTLADIVPADGLALKRLLGIATQLVDAVAAAHQRGIVHRDLKPANVMVMANDRVKVLDFGLAKVREPDAEIVAALPTRELTGEGKIVGTVAYMSPEQAEGKMVDERSDIFSIGVMLYEMATGERPFTGETSLSVLSAILKDTPKSLSEIKPALPRELSRIVRHCLSKDLERRFQSAKDLRNDLEELAQSLDSGELTVVAPAAPTSRRYGLFAAAVVALLAVTGASLWLWFRTWSQPRATAPPNAVHSRLTQVQGIERYPSISPDGKWVVYVSDAAGNNDLYLQSVTGQTAINLTKDSPRADTMPAFSPDGETIAFRSQREGGGIFLMGRTGDAVRRLTTDGFSPSWFPDGQRIVFASEGVDGPEGRPAFSELWVVGASGGEPRLLFAGDAVQPRVSPHGKRIAFWSVPSDPSSKRFVGSADSRSNRDVWTIDINGAHAVRVTTDDANDWNPVWSPDGQWLYFLSARGGSMNLWRVAIEEDSGAIAGEPQPLTAPAPYVADFTLSADGKTATYASILETGNIGRIGFDPHSGTIVGAPEAVTSGTRNLGGIGGFDVTTDGRSIVTTTSPRGQEDLYLISAADGAIRQLTNDSARDRAPRWSPDGRHIYFNSDRNIHHELWMIDADGGGLRQLSKSAWRGYPAPSRDGSRLAGVDQNDRTVFIYDANDWNKPPETLPPFPDTSVGFPFVNDWSPDGRSVAISAGGTTWTYSFDTKQYRRITNGGGAHWLADGRRLIHQAGGPRARIAVTDTLTGESTAILSIDGEAVREPRLAAGDTQLFFIRNTLSADVWIVRFSDRAQ